ncbi:putative amidoligase enzyme-domain-containing protein [Fusarium flagelliforme]|uniref:Amidoligase enzyme n=1 Tax=Fusarium flagelliforme TaxID=2675880 RepID=A0A395MI96_9HYPO|nr:putative amidoligase enzyme-domain-containing protein [Fusarium flagelliforme]KAH7188777.1 putative amidoligase enzyme-domain-containing protein [Fusarium flagelliforme]RFN47500.1 hypothetical protein FIE12Z_8246 [Fusarium flagelliforme]
MAFLLPKVQVQLGFLIAVGRSEEREDFQYNEIPQHPGEPIPQPPGKSEFDRIPPNANEYPHLKRQCLNRAQWAIEVLDDELQGRRHSCSPLRSIQRKPEAKIPLKEWTVEFDGHVEENQANQFDWVGVKLTSPIFENASANLDLEKQLKKILLILNKKYLTVSNADTRLKVAVYLNRYSATPEQMKAIAALIWIVDPLLGDVHPPHCGPNSIYSLGLQYSKLVTDKSPLRLKAQLVSTVRTEDPWNNHLSPSRRPLKLLSYPGELKDAKYLDAVDKILDADSVDDLIDLMNVSIHDAKDYPQASPAYCFELPAKSGDMAIWFNQHCGTLDYAGIDNWIAFCVGVIQLSIGKSGASISDLYPRLRCSSGIFAFLRENGLREPAAYFEAKLQTNKIPDLDRWPIVSEALSFRDEDSLSSSDDFSSTTSFLDRDFTPSRSARNIYSFGIELEMYIPKKRDGRQSPPPGLLIDFSDSADASVCIDPHSEDDRQTGLSSPEETVDQIAAVLTENGLLATNTAMHDRLDFDQTAWLKMLVEHGLVPVAGIDHKYQTWTVTTDGSLHAFYDWAGYESASGIEVVSPVLQDKATSWENVVSVLSSLRNNFRLLETNNCGFHIHIAKGMETLSIHLLRKLCILMCCVEDVILRLCHPSRRGNKWALNIMGEGSFLHDNYNERWQHLEVTCDFWQYVPCSMASFPSILGPLKKIWNAKDEKELQVLLNPSGFDFNKSCIFLPKWRSLNGTVEFRYLEGTLDPELIIRWGQLLTALFRFADKAPTEKWEPFLTTAIRSRQSGALGPNLLRGFLTFLGLEDDYDFWTHRVDTMSRLEGDNDQPSCRPDEDQKFCSRINEGQIAALHKNLCRRERTRPFLKGEKAEEVKGGATESASSLNP